MCKYVKKSLLMHYSHFQHWTREDSFKLKDLLCSQSCFSEQLPESPVSLRSGNPIRWDLRYLLGNVFVVYDDVLVFGPANGIKKLYTNVLASDGLGTQNPDLFRILEVPWRNGLKGKLNKICILHI